MKTIYKILIPVLAIAVVGGSYFAFSNLKIIAKESKPAQQTTVITTVATPNNVGLPDSKTLENAIGQYGVVLKTDLIKFKTGETYAVVCATKIAHDDHANLISYGQIFVLQNVANSANWQMVWKLLETKTEMEAADIFTDINHTMYDNSTLVAVALQTKRGAKATVATLHVFQINKNGEVISKKEEEVENVKLSVQDNDLIASGRFGSYQMGLDKNNIFTNTTKTPLQIVEGSGENIKLYFSLIDGVIIPESNKTITAKLGSTVVFVPKDEITAQALKTGSISFYTNGSNGNAGDDTVATNQCYYLSVPAFNFNETRMVRFLIVGDLAKVPFDTPAPPTFSVNVIK